MYLNDNSHHFPLYLLPFTSKKLHPIPSYPFEASLIVRLKSLIPIAGHTPSIPLTWLSRAVDLLSLTLTDAAALISDPSLSGSDKSALASHLDASVKLLDACNSITAEIERLSTSRLLIRFTLHLLSFSGSTPAPEKIQRARKAIAEWETSPRRAIRHFAGEMVRSLAPSDSPRGKISAVRRAIYALEAVSALVAGAVVAVLGGGEKGVLDGIRVSGEFPWAEAFNGVRSAICEKLGKGFSGELEAVEAAATRLAAVVDGVDDEEKTERLRIAVEELETKTEELTAGLDRLSSAVNGLFRAGLCTRSAALQSFRIAPQKCK